LRDRCDRQLAADPRARSAAPRLLRGPPPLVTSSVARSASAYWRPAPSQRPRLRRSTKTFANETADTPMNVNPVDPGALDMRMRAEAYAGQDYSMMPKSEDVTEIFVTPRHARLRGHRAAADPRNPSPDRPPLPNIAA